MPRQTENVLLGMTLALVLATGLHCSMGTNEDALRGSWRWTQSVGGFAGWTLTPATEGYAQRLELEPGGRFAFVRADSLMATGTFSIETEGEQTVIRYRTDSSWWFLAGGQQLRRPSPDTLVLRDRCTDCYTHTFVRR